MSATPYVAIGRVVKTHGLKGEVSVALATDLPFDVLVGLEVWFVPPPSSARSGRIRSVRPGPKGPLIAVDGISNVDEARALCGSEMLVVRGAVPVVEENPADDESVVGVLVVDEVRGEIGVIAEVIVTGANDVWVVDEGPFGQVLIPVIDDVVLGIDGSGDIRVNLLPGLIDDGSDG
ncbi:MAG: 16S rRNA processing protein RimM [Coriobacteriia bacterium]|nr:16S rRNA processing protein RimM [Coriobacteriia bacterium]